MYISVEEYMRQNVREQLLVQFIYIYFVIYEEINIVV